MNDTATISYLPAPSGGLSTTDRLMNSDPSADSQFLMEVVRLLGGYQVGVGTRYLGTYSDFNSHIDKDVMTGVLSGWFGSQDSWLSTALDQTAAISSGADRAYAEAALRNASMIARTPPKISKSPEGGVSITHKAGDRLVTVIVENKLGVLVSTSSAFQLDATFELNMSSIDEFLRRYNLELSIGQF